MTPRAAKPSWHERSRRTAKAEELVKEIGRLRKRLGISQSAMLESVAHWPELWWAQCALQVGKAPPSDDTKTMVLAALAKGALVERMAEVRT